LRKGCRGLKGSSSLAQLLEAARGVRNRAHLSPLSVRKILSWVDAHHRRMGAWPVQDMSPIAEAPGETWRGIDAALRQGQRGLPGGSSLPRLLAERRGVRNRTRPPALTLKQILKWADAHQRRTGRWPSRKSGPIPDAPGETWTGVQEALDKGRRGLPGGSSLSRLLAEHRGVRKWTQRR